MSVLANIFLFDVISIKCEIKTIRKDFVKMSINVFDVRYAPNLLIDHHSLLNETLIQNFGQDRRRFVSKHS